LKGRRGLQLTHQLRQQGELQDNSVNVLRAGIIIFLKAGNNFVCVCGCGFDKNVDSLV